MKFETFNQVQSKFCKRDKWDVNLFTDRFHKLVKLSKKTRETRVI